MSKFRFSQLDKKADRAMKEAVNKVVAGHKKTGRPLAVWKDGKVVGISAGKVKLG